MSNDTKLKSPTKSLSKAIASATALCLACSASLPPSALKFDDLTPSPSNSSKLFITPCCQRPICSRCVGLNPRLTRYDPCLACLGGVDVIGHRFKGISLKADNTRNTPNIDGALRDEDTFILGDDEDDEDDDLDFKAQYGKAKPGEGAEAEEVRTSSENPFLDPPPRYSSVIPPDRSSINSGKANSFSTPRSSTPDPPPSESSRSETSTLNPDGTPAPQKYFINRNDTLQGIVLRYRLDTNEVCKMNNLPLSTLRTTPHLLHTRRYILLPPSPLVPSSSKSPQSSVSPERQKELEKLHARERAAKRLQTFTKEVDWDVAKAYVAIADDEELSKLDEEERDWKRKEGYGNPVPAMKEGESSLESRAVEQYLEDAQWEEEQRQALAKTSSSGFLGKMKDGANGWWQKSR